LQAVYKIAKSTSLQSSSDSLCESKFQHRLKKLCERIEQLENYTAELLAWGHHLDDIRKQLIIGLLDEQEARDKDKAKCAELEEALQETITRITWYREKYPEAETDAGQRLIH
jgi:hypothetical protein